LRVCALERLVRHFRVLHAPTRLCRRVAERPHRCYAACAGTKTRRRARGCMQPSATRVLHGPVVRAVRRPLPPARATDV
jgi:hypothetical protein